MKQEKKQKNILFTLKQELYLILERNIKYINQE